MPTDVAAALRDDGWYLRSMIPQIKTNPMPESTKDRPTNAVEYWFLLAKSPRYFYDQEAVKEPVSGTANPRVAKDYKMPDGWNTGPGAHGKIHPKGREKGKARQRAVPPSHAGREAASHQSLENPEYDHRMRPPGVTPKSAPAGSGIKSNESYQAAMVEQPATRNMRNWVMAATAPVQGSAFRDIRPAHHRALDQGRDFREGVLFGVRGAVGARDRREGARVRAGKRQQGAQIPRGLRRQPRPQGASGACDPVEPIDHAHHRMGPVLRLRRGRFPFPAPCSTPSPEAEPWAWSPTACSETRFLSKSIRNTPRWPGIGSMTTPHC